jgi:hypothetical protein
MTKEINSGRIRYVEPSNFFNQQEGTFSDAINFPYEDYNMAIDLTIRKVNRYSCGWWTNSGEQNEITYSSKNGSISFLGGTKYNDKDSFLTTNFTDISMTSPENNTKECLGIESINISYNSWLVPQVSIKFIDVRGATVMQPAENNYFNNNNVGVSSEIYRALFSFPPPTFILKVKGFYGKGVTYNLTVNKTNFEFDSSTGSFNITVDFIGYLFGIYADLPMTFLAIAPYTSEGRSYWKRKVDEGIFKFRDADGNITSDMLKIPELRMKLAKVASSEETTSAAAEGVKVRNNYEERLNALKIIKEDFPFKNWFEVNDIDYVYNIVRTESEMENFIYEVSGYVETVKNYDETYGTNHLSKLDDLVKYSNKKYNMPYIEYVATKNKDADTIKETYTYSTRRKNKENYETYIKPYDEVKQYIDKKRNNLNNFYVYVFPKNSDIFNVETFYSYLDKEVEQIQEKQKEKEVEYKNREEKLVEQLLGFKPSVKNIYDLVFAHMDTFIHCFYSNTKKIKDQLEGDKTKRSKIYYGINDGDTDTERVTIKTSNGDEENTNPQSKYLPPYAAYYKSTFANNERKRELRWPGEIINGNDLEEVKFVIDFLNASELYYEDSDNVTNVISSFSNNSGESSSTYFISEAPSTGISNFIPLSTYDLINKDTIRNPYDSVRDKISKGIEGVAGEILGKFAIRALYYLGTNDLNYSEAKSYGILEAVNLYKAVKDNYSDEFIDFIKKFTESNRQNKNDFIDIITTTSENKYTKPWRSNIPCLNKYLVNIVEVSKNYKLVCYAYHNSLLYDGLSDEIKEYAISTRLLPLYFYDFDELKKKYTTGKSLINDKDFIFDNVDYSMNYDTMETFKLLESRDYIKYIYVNVENEVRKSKEEYTEGDYGNRKNDDYGKLKNANKTLKRYEEIIESEYTEKSYAKGIIVDDKGNKVKPKKVK